MNQLLEQLRMMRGMSAAIEQSAAAMIAGASFEECQMTRDVLIGIQADLACIDTAIAQHGMGVAGPEQSPQPKTLDEAIALFDDGWSIKDIQNVYGAKMAGLIKRRLAL